jgi:5,10-methylenetetrahydromethanopterin reductase
VDYGLGLFLNEPPGRLLDMVSLVDRAGFSHAWIADSQVIWRETYVTLGAAAVRTDRVVLGTGVTQPVTRDLTVTASAFATLSELTGGRVALGLGSGDSALETLGRGPVKLAELEASVGTLRGLFGGRTVPHLGTDVQMGWIETRPPPIFIAGSGPRILRLAGKIADGVIMLVGVAAGFVEGAMQAVQEGARSVGRDLESEGFKYVLWTPCSINDDGAAARDAVKAHVARVLKRPLPYSLSDEHALAVREIYEQYEYYEHMAAGTKHGDLVPDGLVNEFAIAGTVDECREQVERIEKLGVDQLAIIPHAQDPGDRLAILESFTAEILPSV